MNADYAEENGRARRHERKRQRLGSPTSTCLCCGCLNIESLLNVPARELPRWFLEEHHIAARVSSNFTVILCRNCHAILTDRQHDWNPELRHPKVPSHRLAALLQG